MMHGQRNIKLKLYLYIRSLLQDWQWHRPYFVGRWLSKYWVVKTAEEVAVALLNPFLSDGGPTDFILLCGLCWNAVYLVFIQTNFTLVVVLLRAPPSRRARTETAGCILAEAVTCFQKILCNASRQVACDSCDPFLCKWTSNSVINISVTNTRRRYCSIQGVYFVVSLSNTAVLTDTGCGKYSVMWQVTCNVEQNCVLLCGEWIL